MKNKLNEKLLLVAALVAVVIVVIVLFALFKNNNTRITSPENIKSLDTIASSTAEKCIDANWPIKERPSFNEVAQAGCGDKNRYIGKEVIWRATISTNAHTGGIRFWVVDAEHPYPSDERKKHGFFWGTFLVSGNDPRNTDQGLKQWEEKWQSSWINYIMDVYGGIDYNETAAKEFLVTAVVNYVNCDQLYDGCYIETSAKKIIELK